ncbi:4'-phosphopantetheinyl transferase superfamily protein [Pseudomonas sp. CCI1.2]|uniref:4'-phosphopantetheinyl transferase family protein n=2 Tax=Pseudomonas TaxID=286 RepID=UPI002AC8D09A|nr:MULTISPECIES: 4'-phosphopantetheinyl transferase superfamily protein [unclassified Pseudomonas]MEB0090507.1 4'-phosphopantetheinyl transferase superfamily protein [Pseudomonas sp. CCI4.2]MEB0123548.1 4'-phosphopantetheinyl transferase superfamily protein [Pseudomonas sp. CCI1.2]WPX55661.1 4'-phosphopantetheinyl transferase superfamily protein [Pseudomonas sp. CCI4.2]
MIPNALDALTVFPWPGPPSHIRTGVLLLRTATPVGASRVYARDHIRQALTETLALTLNVPQSAIVVMSTPGQRPHIVISGIGEVGLSISHESTLSLAAVNLHGQVGVDVMQVQQTPDWHAVALDYLGPVVAAQLMDIEPAQREKAFAQAWCAHEARLKCRGRALDEWSQEKQLSCRTSELALPEGFVGALALCSTKAPLAK